MDVAIDNGGVVGDAAIAIEGLPGPVGPTSTVAGAAIVNAIVAETVERLVARGIVPEVFISSNVAGGDAANDARKAAAARMTAPRPRGASPFAIRGVIEGYYGRPWTHDQRLALIDFLADRGMNMFVYGPKDDPLLRADWRTPYDGEALEPPPGARRSLRGARHDVRVVHLAGPVHPLLGRRRTGPPWWPRSTSVIALGAGQHRAAAR